MLHILAPRPHARAAGALTGRWPPTITQGVVLRFTAARSASMKRCCSLPGSNRCSAGRRAAAGVCRGGRAGSQGRRCGSPARDGGLPHGMRRRGRGPSGRPATDTPRDPVATCWDGLRPLAGRGRPRKATEAMLDLACGVLDEVDGPEVKGEPGLVLRRRGHEGVPVVGPPALAAAVVLRGEAIPAGGPVALHSGGGWSFR